MVTVAGAPPIVARVPTEGSKPRPGVTTGPNTGTGDAAGIVGTITLGFPGVLGLEVGDVPAPPAAPEPPPEPPPELPPELPLDPPPEAPGIVIDTETVVPVPIRFVAPIVTVTVEPAVKPVTLQKVSVATANEQATLTP